jgi:hypothetical protein
MATRSLEIPEQRHCRASARHAHLFDDGASIDDWLETWRAGR